MDKRDQESHLGLITHSSLPPAATELVSLTHPEILFSYHGFICLGGHFFSLSRPIIFYFPGKKSIYMFFTNKSNLSVKAQGRKRWFFFYFSDNTGIFCLYTMVGNLSREWNLNTQNFLNRKFLGEREVGEIWAT